MSFGIYKNSQEKESWKSHFREKLSAIIQLTQRRIVPHSMQRGTIYNQIDICCLDRYKTSLKKAHAQ